MGCAIRHYRGICILLCFPRRGGCKSKCIVALTCSAIRADDDRSAWFSLLQSGENLRRRCSKEGKEKRKRTKKDSTCSRARKTEVRENSSTSSNRWWPWWHWFWESNRYTWVSIGWPSYKQPLGASQLSRKELIEFKIKDRPWWARQSILRHVS